MHKKNPLVIASISLLALAIGAGVGFGVFVFHEEDNGSKTDFTFSNEEGTTSGIDHLVYKVGQFQTTKVNGTSVNHGSFFVDPVTQAPLTDSASLKKTFPVNSSYIPYGTEAQVGIPVLFKKVDNQWVVDSDYTFVGWSQLSGKVWQMVNDETKVPDMHSFVCDGYNIAGHLDGDKVSSDPKGLYLYPAFYRSKLRCYAEWDYKGTDCTVTLPYMKSQVTYTDGSTTKRSAEFFAFRLVNLPDFDTLVLSSSDHTSVTFRKGSLFANAAKPYDIFVNMIENDDENALTDTDRAYKSDIPALDAANYAHYDKCVRVSNPDGTFDFDVSFYYKKEAR